MLSQIITAYLNKIAAINLEDLYSKLPDGQKELDWAKENLHDESRIFWFYNFLKKEKDIHKIKEVKKELEHYISLGIQSTKMKSYKFKPNDPWETIQTQLKNIENVWQQELKKEGMRLIPEDAYPKGSIEKFIDLGGNWAWWDLKRAACDVEGKAMGHCGNIQGGHDEDALMSLREEIQKDGRTFMKPHITFALNKGYIGEIKGVGNSKPTKQFHKAITTLLEDPRVKGLVGGGFDPHSNFKLDDLTEEEQAELKQKRPELFDWSHESHKEENIPYHFQDIFKFKREFQGNTQSMTAPEKSEYSKNLFIRGSGFGNDEFSDEVYIDLLSHMRQEDILSLINSKTIRNSVRKLAVYKLNLDDRKQQMEILMGLLDSSQLGDLKALTRNIRKSDIDVIPEISTLSNVNYEVTKTQYFLEAIFEGSERPEVVAKAWERMKPGLTSKVSQDTFEVIALKYTTLKQGTVRDEVSDFLAKGDLSAGGMGASYQMKKILEMLAEESGELTNSEKNLITKCIEAKPSVYNDIINDDYYVGKEGTDISHILKYVSTKALQRLQDLNASARIADYNESNPGAKELLRRAKDGEGSYGMVNPKYLVEAIVKKEIPKEDALPFIEFHGHADIEGTSFQEKVSSFISDLIEEGNPVVTKDIGIQNIWDWMENSVYQGIAENKHGLFPVYGMPGVAVALEELNNTSPVRVYKIMKFYQAKPNPTDDDLEVIKNCRDLLGESVDEWEQVDKERKGN